MKIQKKQLGVVGGTNMQFPNLPKVDRPAFADTLRFPDDVTQLAAANVSEVHGKYSALYAFANQELCRVNVKLIRLRSEEEAVKARILSKTPGLNGIEKWRRDTIIDADEKTVLIRKEITEWEIKKNYAQMYLKNFEIYLAALSRELSRKGQERI